MKKPNSRNIAESAKSVRTYGLILMLGLLLVSGFFFAARQHFSSMDYGMKNSRLRKQIEDLEAEKRRLLLAREISMSPAEIKKAAKRTGLVGDGPESSTVARLALTRSTAAPEKELPAAETSNPLVTKTVAVSSAAKPVLATFQASLKPATPAKRAFVAKNLLRKRKIKSQSRT